MISTRTMEIIEYMTENNAGECMYRHRKVCDGLCNNCPYNYYISVEEEKARGTYRQTFAQGSGRNWNENNDYEGAILARQEMYELF